MKYLQNSDAKSSGVSGAEGGIPGGVYSPLGHTIPLLLVEVGNSGWGIGKSNPKPFLSLLSIAFVVHLAGPLDGLAEAARTGHGPIGGVIVSRRDRSLCVEDFRHVFVEVCSIAVKGIALHEGQGAGDHRFQRIPQQRAKHVTVVEQVYSGYLLYLCSM